MRRMLSTCEIPTKLAREKGTFASCERRTAWRSTELDVLYNWIRRLLLTRSTSTSTRWYTPTAMYAVLVYSKYEQFQRRGFWPS